MDNKVRIFIFTINLLFILLVSGCSFSRTLIYITPDKIDSSLMVFSQSNIILRDASILHCPHGFLYENDTIKTYAELTTLDNGLIDDLNFYRVPIDSVAAIKYYKPYGSAGTVFGNIILSLSAPFLPFSISCLIDPKSCFGSCPTVYTYNGITKTLEAELFSSSISGLLENNDIDILKEPLMSSQYKLMITNEAMETHYINKFNVYAVYYNDTNSRVLVSDNNKLVIISNKHNKAVKVINFDGKDVSSLTEKDDEIYYRSGIEKFRKIENGELYDNIIVTYKPKPGLDSVNLVLKSRNTLLSTTLLYDVVIGSQGAAAIDWYNRMSNDTAYVRFFKKLYDEFSGIKIYRHDSDKWTFLGKVGDGGPINWKESAVSVGCNGKEEIELKLEFVSDNIMIDYLSFDYPPENSNDLVFEKLSPVITSTNLKQDLDEILTLINSTDTNYLVTEPGDYLELKYEVKPVTGKKITFIIESGGFYTEWIRGNWIKNATGSYRFNIFDLKGTFSELVHSWIKNKDNLEELFFKTRIPIRR